LIETIGDLKKRVTELETWEAEKQRYELKQEFLAWCEQHGVTSIAELQPLYFRAFLVHNSGTKTFRRLRPVDSQLTLRLPSGNGPVL
jgi:hypothetical protein